MQKTLIILILATFIGGLQAQQATKTVAKPAVGSSLLSGFYCAPSGSTLILQNNAKNDLTITAKKEAGLVFSSNSFNFATPFPNGAKYKVTLKKAPIGQTCIIYSGSEGTMPQNENTLRICSDYTYDLVSRSSDDKTTSTFYESSDPDVGGAAGEDGRYVVFVSSATFAGSAGKHRQIFWRDRNTGTTKLVSASASGQEGDGDSYYPAISGDGKTVAFESYSTNLVEGDKNGYRDIFVWHSATGKIQTVSVGKNGAAADAESYEASVSGDGNLVAFTSAATNLTDIEKDVSNNNVFLRDMLLDTTIMISIDPKTKKGGGGSKPSISFDGNRIAFYSHTGTLVPDDNNGLWDIFLWEKNIKSLKRISLTSDHKERNQGNESANRVVVPAISGNGRFIAYATTATNIVPNDINNFQDVFLYDSETDSTIMVSNANDGKQGNSDSPIGQGEKIAITYDGSWVAFSTNASNLGVPAANVLLHNRLTGRNKAVSEVVGGSVGRATLSQQGGYVVFGIGGKLDSRFQSSGIFANFTGVGPCRFCPE
ncbi:MAG: hypothetical protein Q7U54_20520 [Bacteroidales bacterium]|nr:hypothetical protein [Bacteroidales bacterium]